MSFAESLKDSVSSIFGWDRELLDGVTRSSRLWREQVDQWWANRLNIPDLTPRWVLQNIGTEVFRNNFHDDIWIASLENKLTKTDDNIVITDCRFKNEIESIRRSSGIVIQVKRGSDPEWYQSAICYNSGPKNLGWALSRQELELANIHASEYSHVGLTVDYVIENNTTIDDLNNKVNDLVLSYQSSKYRAAA